jgi:hypothetical protein
VREVRYGHRHVVSNYAVIQLNGQAVPATRRVQMHKKRYSPLRLTCFITGSK